jgi:hypothetical protein
VSQICGDPARRLRKNAKGQVRARGGADLAAFRALKAQGALPPEHPSGRLICLSRAVAQGAIPGGVDDGAVPLNPLGWFGYGELAEVSVERRSYPFAYWLIVLLLTALAALFGLFIYPVLFRSVS